MSKVEIKLNLPGINKIMKSEGIQSKLSQAAHAVANIAGPEYAAEDPRTIRWIGIVNVHPASKSAAHDNFENNTLLKALQAAGLSLTKRFTKR